MEANIFTVYTTAELFLNYCNSSQTWTFATAAIFGYGQIILEYFMHARCKQLEAQISKEKVSAG